MSPRCTLGSVVPVGRHRVDEGLVVLVVFACSDERRLAVRFTGELRCVHIGNPDLDRPEALLPQAFPMSSNGVTGRWHNTMLHVTARKARRMHITASTLSYGASAVERSGG
jgi:hypothetical protein